MEEGLVDNEYEGNTMEKEIRFAHLKYFFIISDFLILSDLQIFKD